TSQALDELVVPVVMRAGAPALDEHQLASHQTHPSGIHRSACMDRLSWCDAIAMPAQVAQSEVSQPLPLRKRGQLARTKNQAAQISDTPAGMQRGSGSYRQRLLEAALGEPPTQTLCGRKATKNPATP